MVRSTFAGLNMAFLGMNASQKALDVVGQNITNMNTNGYSRQRLDQISISPTGASAFHTPYGARVGQGVLVTGVSQVRDPFLDIRYRDQLSKVGTSDARYAILEEIGDIFDNVDVTNIQNALDDVVKQLQELSTKVGQNGYDNLVRSSFEVMINFIHQNATDLEKVRTDLDTKMDTVVVSNINETLEAIRQLNISIRNSQVMGDPALELKDQRNLLIDDLATYFPIKVEYRNEPVGGSDFTTEKMEIKFGYTDANGDSQWASLIYDDTTGAQNNNGTLVGPLAYGTDANGEKAITFTTTDGQQIELTDLGLGNGVLKGDLQMLNREGEFDQSGVKGIGYYEKLFDSFVYTMATEMNKLNTQYKDANGNPAGGPLFETSDGSANITAANIRISEDWMKGTVRLIASEDAALGIEGSTKNDNILAMKDLLSTKVVTFIHPDYTGTDGGGNTINLPVFEGTMPAAYANVQGQLGIDMKSTNNILGNHTEVLMSAADAREAVMGVNLDEEVMGLLRYAQSYNAAARVMTTMDETLDKLINGTGVAGR